MGIHEEQIEAWDKMDNLLCKGVRVKVLRKLIWLAYYLHNHRMKEIWPDLIKRSKEPWLTKSFDNYLCIVDDPELEHIAKWLGVSKRTARDYISALRSLAIHGV